MAKTINAILNLQDKFTSKLSAAQKETLIFDTKMQDCNRTSKSFEKSLGKIGDAAKKGFAIAGAAAAGFAVSSVNTYRDFEQSMSNVAGTMAIDKTSEDYAKLEQAARDAGKSTTKTATEAADALNYMALAGWSVEESTKGLMPMLRAAEAANADLGTVSDLVTDSMSALNLQVDDMQRYLDVGSKAQSKSNTNLLQFNEAMIGVGGTFKTFNTGIEEGGALLGVLANRGIKGSEAGNALQSTLINLTKKSGESADAMEALGLSAYDSNGKFKGITAVLTELNEKTKDMTEEQRNTYLTMIGGKSQLTTLNALMAGLNTTVADGRTELQYLTDELNNSDGAMDKLSTTMTDNLNGAWARFTSAVSDMQIELGKEFAPYIQKGLDWMAAKVPVVQEAVIGFVKEELPHAVDKTREAFEKAKPVVKWTADHWKGLAIAGGSVLAFMKGFTVVNKVYKTFNALSKAAEGAGIGTTIFKTAMLGLNTSFLACPVTWITAGIVAVGASVAFLATKSKRLRNAMGDTWDIIKGFGKELGEKFLKAFNRIRDIFDENGDDFENLGDALGWTLEKLNPLLEAITDLIGLGADWGIEIMIDQFKTISDYISVANEQIEGFKDLLKGDVKGALEHFENSGVDAFDAVYRSLKTLLGPLGYFVDYMDKAYQDYQKLCAAAEGSKTAFEHYNSTKGMYGTQDDAWDSMPTDTKTSKRRLTYSTQDDAWDNMPTDTRTSKYGTVDDGNALGTSYWKGGPTWVNERGGEIIDLPSGSRVIPADKSEQMIKEGNKNITLNITINGNGDITDKKELANEVARQVMDALEGV